MFTMQHIVYYVFILIQVYELYTDVLFINLEAKAKWFETKKSDEKKRKVISEFCQVSCQK